jgi:hypothetical protein
MTERTLHRGAVVRPVMYFKGAQIHFDATPGLRWQWDMLRDKWKELTGAELAAASKPSRQRRKGPIIRFGGRQS